MITNQKFKLALSSKIGYLTKYYCEKYNKPASEVYPKLMQTYVIKVLQTKESRLFLESVDLLVDALEIEFEKGKQSVQEYLENNIGG